MPAGLFCTNKYLQGRRLLPRSVARRTRGGLQLAGTCLLRSGDVTDPGAWRAWDGAAYTVRLANPYGVGQIDPKAHVCAPIGQNELLWTISSIVHVSAKGMFAAVMQGTTGYPAGAIRVEGVYISYSRDLLTWTAPALLMQAQSVFHPTCDDSGPIMHPSLIDPLSSERNFAETGPHPYLYYSRIHLKDCKISKNVDLQRQAVTLQ